ncbi:MAG: TonB family protein [Mariprofundaceae bacterium]|nr:TonB family protein [Mariprofundaceae bacterium]
MKIETEQKRLSVSFAASVVAHLMLALFITVAHTDKPIPKKQAPQVMDVVLLDPETTPKKTPSKDAKTISNRSAEGGSSKAEDRRTRSAKAPVTGPQKQKPEPAMPAQPKQAQMPKPSPNQRTRTLAKRDFKPDFTLPPEMPKKPVEDVAKPMPRNIPLSNLMPSSMALAELSRDYERERRMKQFLNREADIPVNTREAKYAPYMQAMVRSLEEQWRPGGQSDFKKYSEEARSLLMRITIESNGALSSLEILQPSPIAALNESAIAAIHAASPFRPLPSSWGLDRVHIPIIFEVFEDKFVFRTM